jgi:dihydrofolate synthase / folylpolyglutamate synthase
MVHIAGTNGKTSTARMIAALAGAHGLATGTFTSPQLETVEDQFEYAGRVMSPDELAGAMGELAPIVEFYDERHGDPLTTFEVLTALAFAWFAEQTVDLAVVEAGLGGRLDSTNAARGDVAVITGVALDHEKYLGATIAEIAVEKLGILEAGAALVTGPLDEAAAGAAEKRVAEQDARWYRFGIDYHPDDVRAAVGGWLLDIEGVHGRYTEVQLRLRGRHQVANFATAVAATEALLDRALDEAAVREVGLAVTAPARMELLAGDPPVMVDGAHNPAGMAALAAALREEFPTTRWLVVFGAMGDKDVAAMLPALEGIASSLMITAAATPRAMGVDRVAEVAGRALSLPVRTLEPAGEAVMAAVDTGSPVLVTGSLALAGEARKVLKGSG